ncbi:hypothetical protein [Streptomyces boluensis]|uniref:LysR substrate-binding domain-containing protein n=1 Tax=Streptomyces boluensis TaxID=1775135 RepID=A0A964URJ6_9ACTN|nr:hypothetical protein [Streptomyces boluensis]NBE53135.1 hypothetical protein [Streptomyces boluensis]
MPGWRRDGPARPDAARRAEAVVAGRLDFALVGACGVAPPPGEGQLVWREVAVDPVFVMLAEDHPPAARPEVEAAALAAEAWTERNGYSSTATPSNSTKHSSSHNRTAPITAIAG